MLLRLAAAVAACLLATGAQAQFLCLYGVSLESMLARSGEEPLIQMQMGMGPDKATTPMLLAVAPSGDWTIYYQPTNGIEGVCILSHGTAADAAEGRAFPKPIIPGEDS